MKRTVLIFFLAVHAVLGWGNAITFTVAENKLVERGRRQLAHVKLQNAVNAAAGLSHLNNYVVVVGNNPDEGYLKQFSGDDPASRYVLDDNTVGLLNQQLQEINKTSKVKTYVVLVCPLDFEYAQLPDDKAVLAMLQQKPLSEKKRDYIQPMFNRARQVVRAIVQPQLDKANEPTLYCGYVLLRYYVARAKANNIWLYLPETKNIRFDDAYKRLLAEGMKQGKWSETADYKARIFGLVNVLKSVNADFIAVDETLSNTDIMKVVDPVLMYRVVDQLDGANKLSALTINERIHALKVLSVGVMNNSTELFLVNLLATTPNAEIDILLKALLAGNEFAGTRVLLKCIVSGVDDAGLFWQGDNYNQLMKTIADLIINSPQRERREKTLQNAGDSMLFVWDRNYALKLIATPQVGTNRYAVEMSTETGFLKVEKQVVSSMNCKMVAESNLQEFSPQGYVTYESCEPVWTSKTYILSPFDLIRIKDRSALPMLQAAGTVKDAEVIMPAIMLKYAQDKTINEVYGTLSFLALDVATIAIPITRAYDLTIVAERIYRYLDLLQAAGGAADIGVRLLADHDSKLVVLVDAYNAIIGTATLVGLAGGTRIATDMVAGFLYEVEKPEVYKALAKIAAEGTPEEKAAVTKIESLYYELKNQATAASLAQSVTTPKARVVFAADYEFSKAGTIASFYGDDGELVGTLSKQIESAKVIVFKFQSAIYSRLSVTDRVALGLGGILNANLKILKIEAEGLTETLLTDVVKYFGKDRIKGIDDVWKNEGLAENFTRFQNACLEGKTVWQGALETITGKLAKELGLERVIFPDDVVANTKVVIVSFKRHGSIVTTITDKKSSNPVGILYRDEKLLNQYRYYFESFDGKEKVNELNFKFTNDGELRAYLKLPEDLRGKGISSAMFDDLVNNVLKDKQVKSFHSIWQGGGDVSDNYDAFVKAVDDLQAAFPDLNVAEDAALSTPTGHLLSRAFQFTRADVEIESSTVIRAVFTREREGFVAKITHSDGTKSVTTGRVHRVISGDGKLQYTHESNVTEQQLVETVALADNGVLPVDFDILKNETLPVEEANDVANVILDDAIGYFGDQVNVISDIWDVTSKNYARYIEATTAGSTPWQAALLTAPGQAASKKGLTRVVFKNQKDHEIVPIENSLAVEFRKPGTHVADIKDSNGNLVGSFYLGEGSISDILVYYFDTADGTIKVNGLVVGVNSDGALWAILKLPESLQKNYIASEIFKDAINRFKSNNIEITSFKAQWVDAEGLNTNYQAYLDAYAELGDTQAAAFATPTGKIVKRLLNFTTAEVTIDHQANINVIFRRGNDVDAVQEAIRTFKRSCNNKDLLALLDQLTDEMKGDLTALAKLFNVNGAAHTTSTVSQRIYPANVKVTAESRQIDIDNKSILKYLTTEAERKPFELNVQDGVFTLNGASLRQGMKYNFVMNENGIIYAFMEDTPNLSHAILLAAADLASAGTFIVDNGIITIENWSGHYHPDFESLRHTIVELTARGGDLNSIEVIRFTYK